MKIVFLNGELAGQEFELKPPGVSVGVFASAIITWAAALASPTALLTLTVAAVAANVICLEPASAASTCFIPFSR